MTTLTPADLPYETARIDDALADLAAGRARLFQPDGSTRIYADALHEEKEAALLATFDRALRTAVRGAHAAAHRTMEQLVAEMRASGAYSGS